MKDIIIGPNIIYKRFKKTSSFSSIQVKVLMMATVNRQSFESR